MTFFFKTSSVIIITSIIITMLHQLSSTDVFGFLVSVAILFLAAPATATDGILGRRCEL